ncbi:sporulation integral membrane protein YlbJ [Polycladomyces sp. WAk]|uniref:Sporulation integral membrane protein YlbJ n=1 Tax=Polycladomyces zharkentensis TaxID=2807616 RepID=A0ABS2WFG4_9BACL|nr:sporulation integral membrane protein YlbJ [Polycladomyces sp. WAk]MBN2908277.1 sporulation integral membrane protein YlbJ [Polycladomyces sp. WAk]
MSRTNLVLISQLKSLALALVALFFAVSLVFYPEPVFQASLKGLKIWWDVIFPALFPFFIASEILMGLGVVHFMGILVEPLMRPLFRVPGAGGFVMAMGFASGYPMGAKLTARLREQHLLTRVEGERLVAFTCTADPLFLFGAVAVGFFHDASLGVIIASAHYGAGVLVGWLMRFYKGGGEVTTLSHEHHSFFLIRAFQAMHHARLQDGRTLGKLMGDAIQSSIQTLLMIGGFIMMFSAIIQVLTLLGVTHVLVLLIGPLLQAAGMPVEMAGPVVAGFFEATLGVQEISNTLPTVSPTDQLAVAGAVLAWSGLSVHAQVVSILSKTDIRYTPYLVARFIHAGLSAALTYLLGVPLKMAEPEVTIPAFAERISVSGWPSFGEQILWYAEKALIVFTVLIGLGLLVQMMRSHSPAKR